MTRFALVYVTQVVLFVTLIASAFAFQRQFDAFESKSVFESKGEIRERKGKQTQSIINPETLIKLEESIRNEINDRRTRRCKGLQSYLSTGKIQFFQIEDGTVQVETLLDGDTYYTTARFTPSSTAGFKVISTVPDPCNQDVRDKLAVSSKGDPNRTIGFVRHLDSSDQRSSLQICRAG